MRIRGLTVFSFLLLLFAGRPAIDTRRPRLSRRNLRRFLTAVQL
jgi:hypothetical protein